MDNENQKSNESTQLREPFASFSNAFDARDGARIVKVYTGPNGAGKSTLYQHQLEAIPLLKELPYINPDVVSKMLPENMPDPIRSAALIAEYLREICERSRSSFAMETVFSDAVFAKLGMFKKLQKDGFKIIASCIQLASYEVSNQRVDGRVLAGGHDVDRGLLERRWKQNLTNTAMLLEFVDFALVFDNSVGIIEPFSIAAAVEKGVTFWIADDCPEYIKKILPQIKKN